MQLTWVQCLTPDPGTPKLVTPALPSPPPSTPYLNYDIWKCELETDPDKQFSLNGIIHGFDIVNKIATTSPVEIENYASATKPSTRS